MESEINTKSILLLSVNQIATTENILWDAFGRSNVYEHIRYLRKAGILPRQFEDFTMSHGATLLAVLAMGRLPKSAAISYETLKGTMFYEWLDDVFDLDKEDALSSIGEIRSIDVSCYTGHSKFLTLDGKAIQDRNEPFNGLVERKTTLYQPLIKAWYEYLQGFQTQ